MDQKGVDRYTDPQILSVDGEPFGKADLRIEGIRKFFETHRCNDVCRTLRLPAHPPPDTGTRGSGGERRGCGALG